MSFLIKALYLFYLQKYRMELYHLLWHVTSNYFVELKDYESFSLVIGHNLHQKKKKTVYIK